MPFSFLQRDKSARSRQELTLTSYRPVLVFERLVAGIDNLRHDVFVSAKFTELARHCIFRLLVKYGNVGELIAQRQETAFRPPSVVRQPEPAKVRASDPAEFKRQLCDLLIASLNRAKSESNVSLDLLARVAVLKFLRSEMVAQFGVLLERCRANLKTYEGPSALNPEKAARVRDAFLQLQVSKKTVLRKVGQDLLQTCREVEKESLARLRRSLFGDSLKADYDLFLNRLIFTEDGQDDGIKAEHYVLLGNFSKDADRYDAILELCRQYLVSLGAPDNAEILDALLSAPENAQQLIEVDSASPIQKVNLEKWIEVLNAAKVTRRILAAYEAAPLAAQFSPINAQQLKNALLTREELTRVESLLEEHGTYDPEPLRSAVRRVAQCRGTERARIAARFLRDFMMYHRDLCRLRALTSAMDSVNLISNDRMRELSSMNNTLYEFLLSDEQKPAEERVIHHVILKADIRGSTTLTRTLLERGLNPASHFTLNFYEPVNKLLPIYGATKVFIEGDALILANFEHEGEAGLGVARTCVLAREMLDIVRASNENSRRAGLPVLELGIGICYEDSAPLYLMDGNSRIMISQALNQSDRLSSCNRLARRVVGDNRTSFNVYVFQTSPEPDADPDEFLIRYNLGGIQMSSGAFRKLQEEIALRTSEVDVNGVWRSEPARFHSGVVPLPSGGLQNVVVREARVALVEPRELAFKGWSDRVYYELCTAPAVLEMIDRESVATVSTR
jgi:hypothetical protein